MLTVTEKNINTQKEASRLCYSFKFINKLFTIS